MNTILEIRGRHISPSAHAHHFRGFLDRRAQDSPIRRFRGHHVLHLLDPSDHLASPAPKIMMKNNNYKHFSLIYSQKKEQYYNIYDVVKYIIDNELGGKLTNDNFFKLLILVSDIHTDFISDVDTTSLGGKKSGKKNGKKKGGINYFSITDVNTFNFILVFLAIQSILDTIHDFSNSNFQILQTYIIMFYKKYYDDKLNHLTSAPPSALPSAPPSALPSAPPSAPPSAITKFNLHKTEKDVLNRFIKISGSFNISVDEPEIFSQILTEYVKATKSKPINMILSVKLTEIELSDVLNIINNIINILEIAYVPDVFPILVTKSQVKSQQLSKEKEEILKSSLDTYNQLTQIKENLFMTLEQIFDSAPTIGGNALALDYFSILYYNTLSTITNAQNFNNSSGSQQQQLTFKSYMDVFKTLHNNNSFSYIPPPQIPPPPQTFRLLETLAFVSHIIFSDINIYDYLDNTLSRSSNLLSEQQKQILMNTDIYKVFNNNSRKLFDVVYYLRLDGKISIALIFKKNISNSKQYTDKIITIQKLDLTTSFIYEEVSSISIRTCFAVDLLSLGESPIAKSKCNLYSNFVLSHFNFTYPPLSQDIKVSGGAKKIIYIYNRQPYKKQQLKSVLKKPIKKIRQQPKHILLKKSKNIDNFICEYLKEHISNFHELMDVIFDLKKAGDLCKTLFIFFFNLFCNNNEILKAEYRALFNTETINFFTNNQGYIGFFTNDKISGVGSIIRNSYSFPIITVSKKEHYMYLSIPFDTNQLLLSLSIQGGKKKSKRKFKGGKINFLELLKIILKQHIFEFNDDDINNLKKIKKKINEFCDSESDIDSKQIFIEAIDKINLSNHYEIYDLGLLLDIFEKILYYSPKNDLYLGNVLKKIFKSVDDLNLLGENKCILKKLLYNKFNEIYKDYIDLSAGLSAGLSANLSAGLSADLSAELPVCSKRISKTDFESIKKISILIESIKKLDDLNGISLKDLMKKSPIENIIISDEDLNNILPKDFLSSLNETKISNLKKQLQILIEIAKNIVTKKSSNILKSVIIKEIIKTLTIPKEEYDELEEELKEELKRILEELTEELTKELEKLTEEELTEEELTKELEKLTKLTEKLNIILEVTEIKEKLEEEIKEKLEEEIKKKLEEEIKKKLTEELKEYILINIINEYNYRKNSLYNLLIDLLTELYLFDENNESSDFITFKQNDLLKPSFDNIIKEAGFINELTPVVEGGKKKKDKKLKKIVKIKADDKTRYKNHSR